MTPKTASHDFYLRDDMCSLTADIINPQPGWYVLWTKSNFEQRVTEELSNKSYDVFLPQIRQWSDRPDGRPVRAEPMFKGYLFVRHAIDKASYLDIANTKGVVSLLGPAWNRLAVVPDAEIATIKQLMESRLPTTSYPFLKAGTEVRITKGPMLNMKGILVRTDAKKGYFIVSVQLLQRSVAVSVDCTDVMPA